MKPQPSDTIILCGGDINFFHLPLSTNVSNAMIPVNGKPVIGWILDDLLKKDIRSCIIVLRTKDKTLIEFLERVYAKRMKLKLVTLESSSSILFSLKKGLELAQFSIVRFLLGDTLVEDDFDTDQDFVYVHAVPDSHRWCLARIDEQGIVKSYEEKRLNAPLPHLALCGVYTILDSMHFESKLEECLSEGKTQLSDVLAAYQEIYPIRAKSASRWFDFGNMDNLLEAKQKLLQSRFFNTLSVDPVLNTITKVSLYDEKLENELNWYESLPEKLKVLSPRIISKSRVNGKLHLVSEYYGYPTLAELYLYSDLHIEYWSSILGRLLLLQESFRKFEGDIQEEEVVKMYRDKTFERIDLLLQQDSEWKEIFSFDQITCNGQPLVNFNELRESIAEKAKRLGQTFRPCIMHGDFCFSNILYDVNNHIIRLIDPRGSFGKKGTYGDPRYDLAKLRHSLGGLYDFIIADLFEIKRIENSFELDVFSRPQLQGLSSVFDNMVQQAGFDVEEIRFIEGLLFISMLPLHKDKPLRQQAMFLTGLGRLNEVLI